MADCSLCKGNQTVTCPKCKGSGQLPDGDSYRTCFMCNGGGGTTCPRCNGSGED
jgi:DnaJ-class molecular chaperone